MLFNKVRNFNSIRRYSSNKNLYVTTPIFYVNAAPHIGHLYSAVIADAICRYQRLRCSQEEEPPILFSTGTDEHGTKIQQAAATNKTPVNQYCDQISEKYRRIFKDAQIANTDFIRTTEARHKKAVQHFYSVLHDKGHIYSTQYKGWYCVSDETFLTDSQLRLDESSGLRYSLESGHPVEWTEETNYMFRLSAMQDDVLYWIKQGERVRPIKFEKILLDMLMNEPLPDVSVSRPSNRVHWAIPVPNDETQTVYVWLDALINYLTVAGYPDEKFLKQWPPSVQVIGKDILKFHGIYWPAFLIAAGLEPPRQLYVHSHWTVDGQKMSKSKNNVIDPEEAAKVYSMEGLRYFLLREGVAHSDGNYSNVKALRILNAELADTLGNLLSRVCAKSLNPHQIYPRVHKKQLNEILMQLDAARQMQEAIQQLPERCAEHYENNNFYLAVDAIMSTLRAANNFFECARPWELKESASSPPSVSAATTATGTSQAQDIVATNITSNNNIIDSSNNNNIANNNNNSSNNNNNNKDNKQSWEAIKRLNSNVVGIDAAGCVNALERSYKLETIIAMTMDALRLCGIALQPIIPQLSSRLLDKLNVPQEQRLWCHLSDSFVAFTQTQIATTKECRTNSIKGEDIEQQQQQHQHLHSDDNKPHLSSSSSSATTEVTREIIGVDAAMTSLSSSGARALNNKMDAVLFRRILLQANDDEKDQKLNVKHGQVTDVTKAKTKGQQQQQTKQKPNKNKNKNQSKDNDKENKTTKKMAQ